MNSRPDLAVLIPCHNEETTVGEVVRRFRRSLPSATIHVYDNNSTDGTVAIARAAGATIGREPLQGKGHVVRRMFADVEAEIYVLVDGDDTYDAAAAPGMIERLVSERLDVVTGVRVTDQPDAYRRGHRLGNRLLTWLVGLMFGRRFTDMLSGYRVFSRRFVKTFPALAHGFEIETELTVHALELRLPVAEVPTQYRERPPGSMSKLRTYYDGARILLTIVRLLKAERPLEFFSAWSVLFVLVATLLAIPIVNTWLATGLVPRFPTAFVVVGLGLLAALSMASGLILDTVTQGRREMKRLAYLSHPAPAVSNRQSEGDDAPG